MEPYKREQWQAGSMLCRVVRFGEIESTNAAALSMAREGAPEGTVVLADMQTAGRGRRGRSWFSPPGCGIFLSILLRPPLPAERLSQLTLAAAVAVREAIIETIKRTGGSEQIEDPAQRYKIKWPNDIVAGGRKICGILTETVIEDMQVSGAVIGIGINVNTDSFPEDIRMLASSMRREEGCLFDREALARLLACKLAEKYALFLETGDLSAFTQTYDASMAGRGKEVRVSGPGWEREGTAEGISVDGSLLLRTRDGKIEHIISGEVSLRAIEDYI